MQVEVYPTDGGDPVRLTGDTPEEGVSSLKMDHDRVQSLLEFVEGQGAKGEDYGNEKHSYTFSILRIHASCGLASFYSTTHASSVPPTGRVKFTHVDESGNTVGVSWLEDAIIKATAADWETLATTFDYQISGGRMTTED